MGIDWSELEEYDELSFRVEIILYFPDKDGPIRLVIADGMDGESLTEFKYSVAHARRMADRLLSLRSGFNEEDSQLTIPIAEGLRAAAMKVLASRN